MTIFLADRSNLQARRLHDRIKRKVRPAVETVRRRRATASEAGAYRIVGEVDPRVFLDDGAYPATGARVEIGFRLRTDDPYEHYWFNWIEPGRNLLVGWHRDDTHDDLGPVHLQVNDGSTVVEHRSARLIDSHPLDVVGRRLEALADAVLAVEWDDGRPVGMSG